MKGKKGTTFNCFSPPIMLATIIVEVFLIIYSLYRYKFNPIVRLIVILLSLLALFQVAEYFVCTGASSYSIIFSKMGFIAITFLPILGIHLMYLLADKPIGKLVKIAYMTAGLFALYFIFYSEAFTGHKCTGNYVIFQFKEMTGFFYSIYYFFWLAVGNTLGIIWANDQTLVNSESKKKVQSIKALIVGYYVFLFPTIIVLMINPESRRGVPSILCGFAIALALILALYILPRNSTKKRKKTVA